MHIPGKDTHIHTEGDVDGQVTVIDLRVGNDVLLQDVEDAREHVVVHAARTGTCRGGGEEGINRHQQTPGKMSTRESNSTEKKRNARANNIPKWLLTKGEDPNVFPRKRMENKS